jgi:CRISPR system Cascade subunit CasD
VRIDQPGQLVRDFQTAQSPSRSRAGTVIWKSLPLSYRYYIGDAAYLAVLEGTHELVAGVDEVLRNPGFPLYLGRRSCPPAGPIALGVHDYDLTTALTSLPWQASPLCQRRHRDRTVTLSTVRDASPDEAGAEAVHDVPVSFDPNRRQYAWRFVLRQTVLIDNPHGIDQPSVEHDPMTMLGG